MISKHQITSFVFCMLVLTACGFPRPPDLAQCNLSSDCTSAIAPICIHGTCVASCQVNDHCQGIAGKPFCDMSSGQCVACLDGTNCPTDKPTCDATARVCRGCLTDDECSSGVCLEAESRCANEAEVLFVAVSANSTDVGTCSRASPCATLPYAISLATTSRNIIAITGGQISTPSTISIDRPVYIHGNGTIIHRGGVVVSTPQFTAVTLEELTVTAESGNPLVAVTVGSSGSLRLYHATVTGQITTNGGTISVAKSTFVTPDTFNADGIVCTSGTVAVTQSSFHRVVVRCSNCQVAVDKSTFDMLSDGSISVQGGVARIENNLIMNAIDLADSMVVIGVAPGSTIRFNTFVNTSGVASDGTALGCDGTPIVTSNIFAYNSMHPFTPTDTCPSRYSLFDSTAVSAETQGSGNQVADAALFFVDRARKDFHLSSTSPARGKAEPGLGVGDDIEGHQRPATADIGAYQSQ